MRKILFLLAPALLSLASCDDDLPEVDEPGSVELNLQVEMYDDELELNSETYDAPTVAEGFRINRFSVYLSDLRLRRTGGKMVKLTDVVYLQADKDGEASVTIEDVPAGEYDEVLFNVGLTAAQDATKPADYPAGHPLAQTSEYWVDWKSYIFMKIEGRSDTTADNQARFDVPFTYHIGKSDKLAREVKRSIDLDIDDDREELDLELSLSTLLGLEGGGEPLPLKGVADHQNGLAGKIMANIQQAVTVDAD